MHDLIVRVLSGDATEAERRTLATWRAASPDHERQYAELARVWELTAASAAAPVGAPPPLAGIVAEAERRRGPVVSLAERRARRRRRWRLDVVAVAATAAAVVVAVGIVRSWRSWQEFRTAAGEYRTVPLADGSVVRLAPETVLEVRDAPVRSVRLRGRAFFAVAADSTHPFTVETPSGRTEVLGTRFEVAAGEDSLRLVVIEGRVRLTASNIPVVVSRDEVSRVSGRSAPSAPVPADVWNLLDWPRGLLIFQATPLADALAAIERHFGVPVALSDDDLARRSVTAWFDAESLGDVVETVCAVVGARCTVGDVIEVSR